MVTQTVDRDQDRPQATLSNPVETPELEEMDGSVPFILAQVAEIVENADAPAPVERKADVPLHRQLLTQLDEMVRLMLSFYDSISGPPVSERDRARSRTIKAQGDRYIL